MSHKTYYRAATLIFALITVGHAIRIANGWDANVAGIDVPMWASYAAVLIAGYLTVRGWQFATKKGR